MEYQKITNLLGATSDNVSIFITKKWVEVHDQQDNAEDRYNPSKQIRFKSSMLRSDLCDFSDTYIVVKGTITVVGESNDSRKIDPQHLKIMHHLLVAFQKLIIRSLIMQKTQMLQCPCTI